MACLRRRGRLLLVGLRPARPAVPADRSRRRRPRHLPQRSTHARGARRVQRPPGACPGQRTGCGRQCTRRQHPRPRATTERRPVPRPAAHRTTRRRTVRRRRRAADLAREHGTPLFVYSKAAMLVGAGRLPARLRRPQREDLLRHEGQLLAGRAAGVRPRRLRLRHRLGRRTRTRAGRRAADPKTSSSRASARPAPKCARRWRPASAASTSRAKPSSTC
jgi:hypothetical protein